ncbi:DUF4040 domain-containing protein [Leptolyngbya cf. ectocarpi LEGE 11479]|uniref:DUF4040 domain-containing protein n=1 Tax=Leptolyngbya cf. ectocarpi LEGE 11479 TaxID=1828722 RepID=A0A928WYI8_LEPEC|nr:DUF4040 domain-containing protein [Leptolyngbya cf. ectocarpi LEGE 11479]
MEDVYVVAIAALLPLTACMLVFQVNPYHALVIRGILGAVAALVYILFGAADVALTEALVGTMLSITLYAVAVRSSMSMRMGIVAQVEQAEQAEDAHLGTAHEPLIFSLRDQLHRLHMRLEVIPYPSLSALDTALSNKEIHTACIPAAGSTYHLQTRVARLYDLLYPKLPPELASLALANADKSILTTEK